MKQEKVPYQKQIFVCVNDRHGEKPSCGDHKGEEVFHELRRIAKERGLHPQTRVTQTKCLGQCTQGVNIMIYPDDIWYHSVHLDDVPNIAGKYLNAKN